jgi:hypothetical protein
MAHTVKSATIHLPCKTCVQDALVMFHTRLTVHPACSQGWLQSPVSGLYNCSFYQHRCHVPTQMAATTLSCETSRSTPISQFNVAHKSRLVSNCSVSLVCYSTVEPCFNKFLKCSSSRPATYFLQTTDFHTASPSLHTVYISSPQKKVKNSPVCLQLMFNTPPSPSLIHSTV